MGSLTWASHHWKLESQAQILYVQSGTHVAIRCTIWSRAKVVSMTKVKSIVSFRSISFIGLKL